MNEPIIFRRDYVISEEPERQSRAYPLTDQDFDILKEGSTTIEQSAFFSFLGMFISSLIGLIGFLSTTPIQNRNNIYSIILWTMTCSTLILCVFASILWMWRRKSNPYQKLIAKITEWLQIEEREL